ncbi:MAG: four helix bundle protein [Verrucomicrobiaceae bacterium]|nr:MAG: four helix bundle protein [Verrucomicrobiaceae bacterium]
MKEEERPHYDLEQRLLDFGAKIISLTRKLNTDYAERHIGNQLLRSGTAPLSHHGEAQAAESPADFIHKLRLALKELRESERWLKLINRATLLPKEPDLPLLLSEIDQLIRIFVTSIATAEKRRK